ncbi:MAG: VTT domain-containing protein [Alphaproteobacteria bacterium]|nr:VTT domain-containing protein [Alphaproteobacteria bacterium]
MSIASLAASPVLLCLGVFLTSIVHEETAMVAGGYMIVELGWPVAAVLILLIAGLTCGDWGVYGLGVLARRLPALKRWLRSDGAHRSRRWLDDHLFLVVVVARVFPGPAVLIPTYSGLGMVGVSFARFAVRSVFITSLYVPVALLATTVYGQQVVPRIGWWAWPAMFALSVVGIGGPWARPLRRFVFKLTGIGHAS